MVVGKRWGLVREQMRLKRRQFRALAQPYDVPPHGRFRRLLAQFQKIESVNQNRIIPQTDPAAPK